MTRPCTYGISGAAEPTQDQVHVETSMLHELTAKPAGALRSAAHSSHARPGQIPGEPSAARNTSRVSSDMLSRRTAKVARWTGGRRSARETKMGRLGLRRHILCDRFLSMHKISSKRY